MEVSLVWSFEKKILGQGRILLVNGLKPLRCPWVGLSGSRSPLCVESCWIQMNLPGKKDVSLQEACGPEKAKATGLGWMEFYRVEARGLTRQRAEPPGGGGCRGPG